MKSKAKKLLKIMHVLAWLVFLGLLAVIAPTNFDTL